jgi:hypothetical protein
MCTSQILGGPAQSIMWTGCGQEFFYSLPSPDRRWGYQAMGTGSKTAPAMVLATHLHLVPGLRMSATIRPIVFMKRSLIKHKKSTVKRWLLQQTRHKRCLTHPKWEFQYSNFTRPLRRGFKHSTPFANSACVSLFVTEFHASFVMNRNYLIIHS